MQDSLSKRSQSNPRKGVRPHARLSVEEITKQPPQGVAPTRNPAFAGFFVFHRRAFDGKGPLTNNIYMDKNNNYMITNLVGL
ncbi:MAG TPA: hypothetical protein DEP80_08555 [Anaerolineae bacterium]|nr:hypothetical protein [Anaerolineae bacterium]HCC79643.1 hypothetical protein [Anaerolineae bacterium]HCM96907.1 hypothetical protein [Anaerolineae bacterium]